MKAASIVVALLLQLVDAIPPYPELHFQNINSRAIPDPDGNKLAAVSSETKECTQIGINIIKAGGNAADAMVGTVFCIGVIGMYHR